MNWEKTANAGKTMRKVALMKKKLIHNGKIQIRNL